MAFKGMLVAAVVVCLAGVGQGQVVESQGQLVEGQGQLVEGQGQEEERLFITSTGSNQSVTISNDTIVLFSLVVLGLIAAVVVMGLLGSRDDDATGYTAPTSYASAPTYEESSYAVQRTLEEAAKKFQ